MLLFGAASFPIFLVQAIRQGFTPQSESWDKLLFAFAILAGLVVFHNFNKLYRRKNIVNLFCLLALFGEFFGTVGIEQHPGLKQLGQSLWMGFGPFVFVIMIVGSTKALAIYRALLEPRFKRSMSLFAVVVFLLALLSFFQTRRTLISVSDAVYNMNEFLALSAGNFPYHDFIPQYGGWITLLVLPFKYFLGAENLLKIALYLAFLASMIVLIIAINCVRNSLPVKSFSLATLIVTPLIAVTPFPVRVGNGGSIALLLSALPVRIFGGTLVLSTAIWVIKQGLAQKETRATRLFSIAGGIFSGLSFWTNQDFVLAALVVSVVILFAIPRLMETHSNVTQRNWIMGMTIGVLLYPFVLSLIKKPIQINFIGFFQRQFSSGFGSEPIYTPGPVLLFLPLIMALIGTHFNILRKFRVSEILNNSRSTQIVISSVTGIAYGGWALFGFVYYLNRSFASGQLQILLMPLSISLGTLIGVYFSLASSPDLVKSQGSNVKGRRPLKLKNRKKMSKFSPLIPLAFGSAILLPIASIILLPNPSIEINRILRNGEESTWPTASLRQTLVDAKNIKSVNQIEIQSVGYFGAAPSFVKLETGISSALIFNMPSDILISNTTKQVACAFLLKTKFKFLLLGGDSRGVIDDTKLVFCEKIKLKTSGIIPSGNLVEIVKGEKK